VTVPLLTEAASRLVRIPLRRPWGRDVTEVTVVTVDIRDSDGGEGHGFAWTPTIGGRAVQSLLDDDLLPFALGRPAEPDGWRANWEHLHEAGSGGLTTVALAGLDLAIWDLLARRAHVGVSEMLGRRHPKQPVYGSGINLHYSKDHLVEQVTRWVDAGYRAVKIKVGKSDLTEDLERVAAVREVLGPERGLMVDANQRWDLDEATRAARALAEFDIAWMEEPLRADDLAGHAELRRRTTVPIALGENLHTWYRFRDALDMGAADIVQPNVIRVGGITPFLQIAHLANDRGVQLAPHLLPELSAQLAFALSPMTWVEDVEDAGFDLLGALAAPSGVHIEKGWASAGPGEGLGIRFR
jgi:L-alanine-DL-glutamate epimerase-like enolase superfamily enzyme